MLRRRECRQLAGYAQLPKHGCHLRILRRWQLLLGQLVSHEIQGADIFTYLGRSIPDTCHHSAVDRQRAA